MRSCVLHAISVAFATLTHAWASAATSRRRGARMQAELDRANTEIALLTEELSIKSNRLERVPPRRRPHYSPTDRMRILQLKAARGWSSAQTAEPFAVTEDTIASWLRRTDEEGDRALVQAPEPVNKFPDYVAYLVRCLKTSLKTMCPAMGKKRIAQTLARAGLHLGTTTVGRMLQQQPDPDQQAKEVLTIEETIASRAIKARRPNHTWHIDLTVVPTTVGFWVRWMPFSKLQRWPFCWWVAVVVDQFSRRVTGFALFTKTPTSAEVCRFLDRVTLDGKTPAEVYRGSASGTCHIEPRPRWPVEGQTRRAAHIRLLVKLVEGRRHLPIVELQRAA